MLAVERVRPAVLSRTWQLCLGAALALVLLSMVWFGRRMSQGDVVLPPPLAETDFAPPSQMRAHHGLEADLSPRLRDTLGVGVPSRLHAGLDKPPYGAWHRLI